MPVISGQSIFPLNISGSVDSGGCTATFSLINAGDLILPDQEIIIYIDDKFGRFWVGSQQVFRGYIPASGITIDRESGITNVTAYTADYMLSRLFLPGTAFRKGNNENSKTPASLTLPYIINNILTRMTNAANYIAWDLEPSTAEIAEYSIDEGDPWSWFKEIAKYEQRPIYFTRANLLKYRIHPMFRETPPLAVFDFNKDTATQFDIEKLDANQVSQVYLLGFEHYNTFTALYPANPVEAGGKLKEIQGIPVRNQTELDAIARRLFIFENSKYSCQVTDIRNHHLDLLDIVTVTHSKSEDDIEWDGKRFYVDGFNFEFSELNGSPSLTATYELKEIPDELYFDA